MRILHTSDWHVGKVLKGQSRTEEHIAVLAEVVEIAQAERPDLVIVAGDLYDTAAPDRRTPTRIVTRALSRAARAPAPRWSRSAATTTTAPALDALRPWAEAAGITLRGAVGAARRPLIIGGTTAGGERVAAGRAAVPVPAVRGARRGDVRADRRRGAARPTPTTSPGCSPRSTEGFAEPDTVNLVTAHLTVVGASTGGGEREAHTIMGVRRAGDGLPGQRALRGARATCTAPRRSSARARSATAAARCAVDFGEEENVPSVTIVEVTRRAPRRRCATVPVTVGDAAAHRPRHAGRAGRRWTPASAWLRVFVREPPRAGLREEVQELLPRRAGGAHRPGDAARAGAAERTAAAAPAAPRASCSPTTWPAAGTPTTASGELFDELYEEVEVDGAACGRCGWTWPGSPSSASRPPSTSPTPTSSRWSARPARASRRCSTRSASPSTAPCPAGATGAAIANALAPSATEARVRLVFESAGARYVATRVVRRDGRGNGHDRRRRAAAACPPAST